MPEQTNLVYGFGINDADYPVSKYKMVDGKCKMIWRCQFYMIWKEMLARCYSPRIHKTHKTYVGCSVCPEWKRFSAFKEWMEAQDWQGKCLDKDILVEGNKVYSPETCVFVTQQMNNFLTGSGKNRGAYPNGVILDKQKGKFRASCCDPIAKKREHVGYFDTPGEAHAAWRNRKHELACRYALQVNNNRLAEALRSRFAQAD